MIELGHYCLIAGFLLCVYGTVAASLGGYRGNLPPVRSAENSVVANFVTVLVASVSLCWLFLTDWCSVSRLRPKDRDFRATPPPRTRPLFSKILSLPSLAEGSTRMGPPATAIRWPLRIC